MFPVCPARKQVWVCCAVTHVQVGQPSCWVTTELSLAVQELNGGTRFVLCAASHSRKTEHAWLILTSQRVQQLIVWWGFRGGTDK